MFKVTVEIADSEIMVDFVQGSNPKAWEGSNEALRSKIVVKETENGLDEKSIVWPSEIRTPKSVFFERFIEQIAIYKEGINAGVEPEDESNVAVQKPYNPDDIKVRREGFSTYELNRMMTEQNDIDLNPDFQRNLVWENSRKSALIESILLGIPIPVFYFAESKTGKYHVVDGLQRLSTIKQFFNNEFCLKKLEHLTDCEGRYYKIDGKKAKSKDKVLERKHSRRLENAQFQVNVIESASPPKVKYDIFKRINTGGRPLNHQEVRNCVAEDQIRVVLRTLAHSDEFQKSTGGSISDYRMDAQELVLRFIGFSFEKEKLLSYSGDMNSFLDEVLEKANETSSAKFKMLSEQFLKSMRINYHLFGEYCFRKCLSEHLLPGARKQIINKALFVSWSMAVLNYDEAAITDSLEIGCMAQYLAAELDLKDVYYTILTTGTSDKQNLADATTRADELLRQILST